MEPEGIVDFQSANSINDIHDPVIEIRCKWKFRLELGRKPFIARYPSHFRDLLNRHRIHRKKGALRLRKSCFQSLALFSTFFPAEFKVEV